MLRENIRKQISTIIKSIIPSMIYLATRFHTKIFTNHSMSNSTQSALLSLSVPYLPCIKLANLLNNPRIKFILSAKSGNYKNHPSTILSQAGHTFNKHLTIYVTKSAENELCRINAFFCVTAVVVSADFHSVVLCKNRTADKYCAFA